MDEHHGEPAAVATDDIDAERAAVPDDLIAAAGRSYADVVADPRTFGPRTFDLVERARSAHQPEALVLALRAQAWFERSHLNNAQAKVLLDEAARIARRHGFTERLSEVLVTRAAVNHELGHLAPAQRDLDAAIRLGGGAVAVMLQQAVLYQNLGKLGPASTLYRQLLDDPDVEIDVVAKAANNFSIITMQLDRPTQALQLVERGSELAAKVGPALAAVLASTRAWVITQTGRLTEGLAEFDEAARLHIEADLPLSEHYLEYVDALEDLRLIPEALDLAVRSVAEFERQAVSLMAAEGLLRVARLACLQGDFATATAAGLDARRRLHDQRRTAWRARADSVLGEIALLSGQDQPAALAGIRRAATTLDALGLASHAIDAHLTAGRLGQQLHRHRAADVNLRRAGELARTAPVLQRLKGRLALALATGADRDRLRHCSTGLRDLARHRDAFASMELRILASGHGAELGRIGLSVLLGSGTPTQVLSWLERTRAAALIAVQPVGDLADDDDLAALRLIEAELMEARRQDGTEPAALRDRQRTIEDRIRRSTWNGSSLADSGPVATSTADLRRSLGDRILVEYGINDGALFAVVVEPRRTRIVPLGAVADIARLVDQLLFGLRRLAGRIGSARATIAAMASSTYCLNGLTELLLTPLGLPHDVGLVVSPPGGLRRIPWAALWSSPIAVVPAASFWERTAAGRARNDEVLLVAGPELPGATDEVAALRSVHPAPTVLLPPAGTIDAVVEALGTADFAHMACHGRLRSDNPAFSGLQLQDGNLTLHELDIRGIAPHRMVIAACESAVDTSYEGNEVLGFVSALMARGTCGLVASIVVVPDAAAVPLMIGLHRRVLSGGTLAGAVFGARAELDQRDPHDFVNWCAFNAYGAA